MQYVAYRHVPLNDRTLIEITSFPVVESAVGISSRPTETFIHGHVQTSTLPLLSQLSPSSRPGGTYKANFCDRTERTTKSGKGFRFLTAIPFKLGTLPCLSKCKAVRLHLRNCGGAEIRMNGAPDLVYAAEVNRPFSR